MGTTGGKKRLRNLNALVAVLVAVIAVLLGSMLINRGGESSTEAAESSAEQPRNSPLDSPARREPDDPMAMGRTDAPVVLVAYEDFRCPFCAKYATEVAPELKKRYVETGVLRIEWRDFPVFGPQSDRAAKAGRAAARQGAFWRFHDVVYSHAPRRGKPELPPAKLIDYAEQAGISDIERFKADMQDPAVDRAIRRDVAEGTRIGVSATPTFLVNGEPIMGAQPLSTFVSTIEQARQEAR
ncbi:protein-disulfide isomerase [Halopolyspora algeriensis]|uniref:Protein-disulfide isomerase n=1 Tax=Halopolyspora algeriensis TaxID=1500506 RepID=A0A368VWB8_9ACTN|nr:thioredoxin domain-containing protein [Halopolyspora algeriensis]RCW44467.1 protein-disulfide isomerase [Halopolyspora algeriensis]TQM55828.1 protein-disulfide isomerase [Halopolyspora algeriensis]